MTQEFDLIVVGSGPGGYATAARAASMGLHTAIVERAELGGTCLNRGCIPTKALSRSAEMLLQLAHSAELGVDVEGVKARYDVAAARKDRVVDTLRQGVEMQLRGVDVIRGEARFTGPLTIAVGDDEYIGRKVILATGSEPSRLPIAGAELCLTSDDLLEMTELPESVAVIGGGVIGMEFACILNAFGVKVTVLEYCKEILPGFDGDVAKRLRMALKRQGVSIVTSAAVQSVAPGMTVTYEQKGKVKSVEASQVVMAVGRKAVVPDGLVEAGVHFTPRGFVETDSEMRTNLPGLYAVGDVNGKCMLAHVAEAQGMVALGLEKNLDVVPAAVFTTPECAMVGVSEERAEAEDMDYVTGEAIYRSNGKALAMDEPDGVVKVVVERGSGRVAGCHICGAHASDLVQEVALAMTRNLTVSEMLLAIHGHPTLGELVASALEAAAAKL